MCNITELINQWWVVWRRFPNGVCIPQAAFPFHSSARKLATDIGKDAIIRRIKDGNPT